MNCLCLVVKAHSHVNINIPRLFENSQFHPGVCNNKSLPLNLDTASWSSTFFLQLYGPKNKDVVPVALKKSLIKKAYLLTWPEQLCKYIGA